MQFATNGITLAATFLLAVSTSSASKPEFAPAELARSALIGYAGVAEPVEQSARILRARQALTDSAASSPSARVMATLIFSDGLTTNALARMALEHGLDVAKVEFKLPSQIDGTVYTVSVGARDILEGQGGAVERLARAERRVRSQFMDSAMAMKASGGEVFMDLARARTYLVFRAELIGPAGALNTLAADLSVMAFFLDDPSLQRVRSYDLINQEMDAGRRLVPTGEVFVCRDYIEPENRTLETMRQKCKQRARP